MSYYYTRDHLGSVREMTNSSGTIVARYDYDPYGRTTLVSGTDMATFQYTGIYKHQASGLELAMYRAFDPNTGHWLSRDPIGERGGINFYDYVRNDPIDKVDPLGLMAASVSTEVQGFVGFGYTSVTCCDENCNRHIFYYKKYCIGISAEAGFSAGAVTNMTGKGCRGENYVGWFYEFGAGVGFVGGSAAIGVDGNGATGVNDTGAGPGKGGFKSTWCYYILIGQKDFKGGCGK